MRRASVRVGMVAHRCGMLCNALGQDSWTLAQRRSDRLVGIGRCECRFRAAMTRLKASWAVNERPKRDAKATA